MTLIEEVTMDVNGVLDSDGRVQEYSMDKEEDAMEEQDDEGEEVSECGGDDDDDGDIEEEEEEADMDVDEIPGEPHIAVPMLKPKKQRRSRKAKKSTGDSDKKLCVALLLIIAAWVQAKCIQHQTNIIFNGIGAVGTHQDCSRCSVCVGDIIPSPRPLKTPKISSASAEGSRAINKTTDDTFQYLRLNRKDRKDVVSKITARVREVCVQSSRHANMICIQSSQFLSKTYIDAITSEFHLLTSKDALHMRLVGWRYWDASGSALWKVVEKIWTSKRRELIERNERKKETRRERDQER